MFHIYHGFHLVDAYHNMRHQRKYHPADSTKRAVKIASLEYAFRMVRHPESNGYPTAHHRYLRIRHTDVDYGDSIVMGYFRRHHRIDATFL